MSNRKLHKSICCGIVRHLHRKTLQKRCKCSTPTAMQTGPGGPDDQAISHTRAHLGTISAQAFRAKIGAAAAAAWLARSFASCLMVQFDALALACMQA
jgi:hypothetical protein